jgi:hypothetical protein
LQATEIEAENIRTGQTSRPEATETVHTDPANGRDEPLHSGNSNSWRPLSWRLFAAGLAGAGLTTLMLGAFMLLREPRPALEGDAVFAEKVGTLESQVRDLAARPANDNAAALTEFGTRLRAIEQRLDAFEARTGSIESKIESKIESAPVPSASGTDSGLLDRVTAGEAAQRKFEFDIAELRRRIDDASNVAREADQRAASANSSAQQTADVGATVAADRSELDQLAARMTALETSAKTVEQRLAKPVAPVDRAARLAFLVAALRTKIERGEPFAAELAAIKPLTNDRALLDRLEPHAMSGVPTEAMLGREFSKVTPALFSAAGRTQDGGLLERLRANAERLIRIRPVDEITGDDPGSVVSRAEVKATRNDIQGAVAELAKLPPSVSAPAAAWIKTAEARQSALAAMNDLMTHARAALASETTP